MTLIPHKLRTWEYYCNDADVSTSPFEILRIPGVANKQFEMGWVGSGWSGSRMKYQPKLTLYDNDWSLTKSGAIHLQVRNGWSVKISVKTENEDYFCDNIIGTIPPSLDDRLRISFNGQLLSATLNGGDYLIIDVDDDHNLGASSFQLNMNSIQLENNPFDMDDECFVYLSSVQGPSPSTTLPDFSSITSTTVPENTVSSTIRDSVITKAEQYRDHTPNALGNTGELYYWGGDIPRAEGGTKGVDCSGFVLYVLRNVGSGGLMDWGDMTAATMSNKLATTTNPLRGDLVFFKSNYNGNVVHVEFYKGLEGVADTIIGASGGGSSTYADDQSARVKDRALSSDSRTHFFCSIQELIDDSDWGDSDTLEYNGGTFSLGSRGGFVWTLQRFLKAHGLFSHQINGIFGTRTEEAVVKWQNILNAVPRNVGEPAPIDPVDGVWRNSVHQATMRLEVYDGISVQDMQYYYDNPDELDNPFDNIQIYGPQSSPSSPSTGWAWTDSGGNHPETAETGFGGIGGNQLVLGETESGFRLKVKEGWEVRMQLECHTNNYFQDNLAEFENHPYIYQLFNSPDYDSHFYFVMMGGDTLEVDIDDNFSSISKFNLVLAGEKVSVSSPTSMQETLWIGVMDVNPPVVDWLRFSTGVPPSWEEDAGAGFLEKALQSFEHERQIKLLNSNGDSLTYKISANAAIELKLLASAEGKVTMMEKNGKLGYSVDSTWTAGVGIEAASTRFKMSGKSSLKITPWYATLAGNFSWESSYWFETPEDAARGLETIARSVAAAALSVSTVAINPLISGAIAGIATADHTWFEGHRQYDKFTLSLTGGASVGLGFAFGNTGDGTSPDSSSAFGYLDALSANIGIDRLGSIKLEYETGLLNLIFAFEFKASAAGSAGLFLGIEKGLKDKEDGMNVGTKLLSFSSTMSILGEIKEPTSVSVPAVHKAQTLLKKGTAQYSISSPDENLLPGYTSDPNSSQIDFTLSGNFSLTSVVGSISHYDLEIKFSCTGAELSNASATVGILPAMAGGGQAMIDAMVQQSITTVSASIARSEKSGLPETGLDVKVLGVGLGFSIEAQRSDKEEDYWKVEGDPATVWNEVKSAVRAIIGEEVE